MRRILARAKRRSRAFSKVSPSVSLSPFVVELVCAFYFAKGSSSSESLLASRYTTPVMPTFSLSVEGECSKHTRKGRANFGEWRFFVVSRKSKNSSGVAGDCFCASFAFFTLCFVFSSFALLHKGPLRMFEKNAFNTTRVSTFCVYKNTDQKRCQTLKKYSLKRLHIISHLIIIIIIIITERDIKRTREELFRAFQRERV